MRSMQRVYRPQMPQCGGVSRAALAFKQRETHTTNQPLSHERSARLFMTLLSENVRQPV